MLAEEFFNCREDIVVDFLVADHGRGIGTGQTAYGCAQKCFAGCASAFAFGACGLGLFVGHAGGNLVEVEHAPFEVVVVELLGDSESGEHRFGYSAQA